MLIKCQECGHDVSDQAGRCSFCGFSVKDRLEKIHLAKERVRKAIMNLHYLVKGESKIWGTYLADGVKLEEEAYSIVDSLVKPEEQYIKNNYKLN